MTCKVIITPWAQADINEHVSLITQESAQRALEWLDGAISSADSLADFPLRYPLVTEAGALGQDIRSFPYHSHRVVYWVDRAASTVFVLRFYHMARRPLRRADLSW